MSGSESGDEDLGFNILFGNIGTDGQLEDDYLGEDVRKIQQVFRKGGIDSQLGDVPQPDAAGGEAGPSTAAAAAGSGPAPAQDFTDEPTLPEDLQEDADDGSGAAAAAAATAPPLAAAGPTPKASTSAPAVAAAPPAAAAAAGPSSMLALLGDDDDDYDQPATAPAAPAASAVVAAAPPAAAAAVPPPVAPPAKSSFAALLEDDDDDNDVAAGAAAQPQAAAASAAVVAAQPVPATAVAPAAAAAPVAAGVAAVAAAAQPAAAPVPDAAEVEALRAAMAADLAARAARQEELGFAYLDVDVNGEDIIQFSDIFSNISDAKYRDTLLEIHGRKDGTHQQRISIAAARAQRLLEQQEGPGAGAAAGPDEAELLKAEGLAGRLAAVRLPRMEVLSEDEEEGGAGRHGQQRQTGLAAAHIRSCQAWAILQARSRQGAAPGAGAAAGASSPGTAGEEADMSEAEETVPAEGPGAAARTVAAAAGDEQTALALDVLDSSWAADICWGDEQQQAQPKSSRDANNRAARGCVVEELGEEEEESKAEDQLQQRAHSHAAASTSQPTPAAAAAAAALLPLGPAGPLSRSRSAGQQGREAPLGWQARPQAASKLLSALHTHSRMLRLAPTHRGESQGAGLERKATGSGMLQGDAAAAAGAGVAGAEGALQAAEQLGGPSQGIAAQLQLQHVQGLASKDVSMDLLGDEWEQEIAWALEEQPQQPPAGAASSQQHHQQRVLWDLNDPRMIFTAAADASAAFERASALVHPVHGPPAGAAQRLKAAAPPESLPELAHLNISRDSLQGSGRGPGDKHYAPVRHSKPVLTLLTLPVWPADAYKWDWHRPRALFSPGGVAPRRRPGKVELDEEGEEMFPVTVHSLTGRSTTMHVYRNTVVSDVMAGLLLSVRRQLGKEEEAAWLEENPFVYGTNPLQQLHLDLSLREQGITPDNSTLVAVWRCLHPLRSGGPCALPPQDTAVRPPQAFPTTKTLTGQEGHALLLEYLEERPLYVMQRGMGCRLTTYYRKRNDTDNRVQLLKEEFESLKRETAALPLHSRDYSGSLRRAWMIGTPQQLDPDDISPFYDLAPMPPGSEQFAVETTCFRAPAAPQVPAASDFLLIRLPSGAMQLREISGCVSVGQQHPTRRVWVVGSREAVDFEANRFVAYVVRTLRKRAEGATRKKGSGGPASISVKELTAAFGNYGLASPANQIVERLKDRCACVPVPGHPDQFTFKADARPPTEKELQKLVTADMCCQYEALLAGLGWVRLTGVVRYRELEGLAVEKLRLALEHLPLDAVGQQAAALLELAALALPWRLSDAYLQVLKEQRNVLLAVGGVGDPTGRGRGLSYIKEDIRKAGREEAAAVTARADGSIVGTDADLRKLGHQRAGEIMLSKFKESQALVDSLGRWQRIDYIRKAVRDPANSSLVNSDPELLQYVRNIKINFVDQQAKMREGASAVFNAQVESLQEAWEDVPYPEQLTWDSVAAAAAAQAEGGSAREEGGVLRAAGLLQHGKPTRAVPPTAGERRIVRTITFPGPDGIQQQRTLIISDREQIALLNALYKSQDGFGERIIPRPGQKRRPVRVPGMPVAAAFAAAEVNLYDTTGTAVPAAGGPGDLSAVQYEGMDLAGVGYGAEGAAAAGGYGGPPPVARKKPGALKKPLKVPKKAGGAKGGGKPRSAAAAGGRSKRKRRGSDDSGDDYMSDSDASDPDAGAVDYDSDGDGGSRRRKRARTSAGGAADAGGAASAAVVSLNSHLSGVLQELKKWQANKKNMGLFINSFLKAVPAAVVPDYDQVVPPDQQMYLEKIQRKVQQRAYLGVAEFEADVRQILTAAQMYNTLGTGGIKATPALIDGAQQLLEECQRRLQDPHWAATAAHWEALIQQPQQQQQQQQRQVQPEPQLEVDDSWRQDPALFQEQLLAALAHCAVTEDQGAPAGWTWVECDACTKWRLLADGLFHELGLEADGSSFKCADNSDRVGASCDDPEDMSLLE